MDINEDLLQWSSHYLTKKSRDTTTLTRTRIISDDQQLANGPHKQINRKFKKQKIYFFFRDNIWVGCRSLRLAINKQIK